MLLLPIHKYSINPQVGMYCKFGKICAPKLTVTYLSICQNQEYFNEGLVCFMSRNNAIVVMVLMPPCFG